MKQWLEKWNKYYEENKEEIEKKNNAAEENFKKQMEHMKELTESIPTLFADSIGEKVRVKNFGKAAAPLKHPKQSKIKMPKQPKNFYGKGRMLR